jgi:hypothetical protein
MHAVTRALIFAGLLLQCFIGKAQDTTRPYCGFAKARAMQGLPTRPMYKTNNPVNDIGQCFIIPVVVHIIHNGGLENIPDYLVQRQIDVLNEDYGYKGRGFSTFPAGGDSTVKPSGGDANIKFYLATIDPNGNPTSGIEHIQSPYTDLVTSDEMLTKGLSSWEPARYLNIWVVKSIDAKTSTGQEQAYSYLASDISNLKDPRADGIVVTYRFFSRMSPYNIGNYRYGRTVTHESGHFFDLMHTWGGDQPGQGGCNDDDGVDDTPDCNGIFYSQFKGHIADSCPDPHQCGYLRLIQDYMDYSEDACMDIFTKGQISKMRDAILKYRFGMITYQNAIATGCQKQFLACNPVSQDALDISPNPSTGKLNIYPHFTSPESGELLVFDMIGRQVLHKALSNIFYNEISIDLSFLANGMYNIVLLTPNQNYFQKLLLQHQGK